MGMHLAICKNEIERFDKVKENYNGNLPKFLIEINIGVSLSGLPRKMEKLDYGSFGLSLSKDELLDFLANNEDKVMRWHVENLYKLMDKVKALEEEEFMLVNYEI